MTLIEIREDKLRQSETGHYDPWTDSILRFRHIYSLEFFEKLFDDLDIRNKDNQYEMIEAVCYAASCYHMLSTSNTEIGEKFTKTYQARELAKLQNALSKSIEALQKLEPEYFYGSYSDHVQDAFEAILSKDQKLSESLSQSYIDTSQYERRGAIFNDHVIYVLNAIYEATQHMDREDLGCPNQVAPYALSFWLGIIAGPWKRLSNIPITAGHYYEEIGYTSKSLNILYDVMKPLDPNITYENLVTVVRRFARS